MMNPMNSNTISMQEKYAYQEIKVAITLYINCSRQFCAMRDAFLFGDNSAAYDHYVMLRTLMDALLELEDIAVGSNARKLVRTVINATDDYQDGINWITDWL